MQVHCAACHEEYDDIYRDTSCPHEPFSMHTMVSGKRKVDNTYYEFVVVTLEDLSKVQAFLNGANAADSVGSMLETIHKHSSYYGQTLCDTPDRSGRLFTASNPTPCAPE